MQYSDYEKANTDLTSVIYTRLLNEGTDVWRPVVAEKVSGRVLRSNGTPDDSEMWGFSAASQVRVETREFASGAEVVAVELAVR